MDKAAWLIFIFGILLTLFGAGVIINLIVMRDRERRREEWNQGD